MNLSVAMAVRNGERYVEKSINSILSQSYDQFELIVVNDGSTDRTMDILRRISDPRLKIISRSQNGGAASALNMAIRQAAGEWIAIHDADDLSLPDRFEVQMEYVKAHPTIAAVGAKIYCFGESGVPLLQLQQTEKALNRTGPALHRDRYAICPLCHGTAVVSKAKFWKAGGYDTAYKITYDYDLWLKLYQLGAIEKIDRVLYRYRLHSDSLSHDKINTYIERLRCCIRRLCEFEFACHDRTPVIVLGGEKQCRIVREKVAPYCPIEVRAYYHYRIDTLGKLLVYLIKSGEVAAIFQLSHGKRSEITQYFVQQGLILNHHFFNL